MKRFDLEDLISSITEDSENLPNHLRFQKYYDEGEVFWEHDISAESCLGRLEEQARIAALHTINALEDLDLEKQWVKELANRIESEWNESRTIVLGEDLDSYDDVDYGDIQ